jgi:hypothetical protein
VEEKVKNAPSHRIPDVPLTVSCLEEAHQQHQFFLLELILFTAFQ